MADVITGKCHDCKERYDATELYQILNGGNPKFVCDDCKNSCDHEQTQESPLGNKTCVKCGKVLDKPQGQTTLGGFDNESKA